MGRQAGYTIIEVTLFFALTGLLIIGVLAGFNGAIDNNRRTDTTRSFESVIEAAYSSVRTGSVVRPMDSTGKVTCASQTTYPGASDQCVIIGKLLKIETGTGSRVSFFDVVANIKPTTGCNAAGIMGIACYQPRVLNMNAPYDIYEPGWQATVGTVVFKSNAEDAVRKPRFIAMLRDPNSELVYINPLDTSTNPTTGQFRFLQNDQYSEGYPDVITHYTGAKGHICLQHEGGMKTYIRFTGGEGTGVIEMSDDALLFAGGVAIC